MKTLIYQVKVGPNPPKFYDTCIDSVTKYCVKYNIEHFVQTEPALKIRPVNSFRSKEAVERFGYLPIYEKENAFTCLGDYDKVAIIDSDIFIRDQAPNIFEHLEDEYDFGGVLERDLPATELYIKKIRAYTKGQYGPLTDVDWKWDPKSGGEFFNMGLMVMNKSILKYLNGMTPKEFITQPAYEKFVNGEGAWKWSTDQTLLNYWVKKSGMKYKTMDWRWNGLFKAVKDNMICESYFIHFFLSSRLPKGGDEIKLIVDNLDLAKLLPGRG